MSELDDWKQAAGVEAGLRREFYDRALTAESLLQEAYAGHRKQKAEIERLRKALTDIADMDQKGIRADDLGRAARIARAAISSTERAPIDGKDSN